VKIKSRSISRIKKGKLYSYVFQFRRETGRDGKREEMGAVSVEW
jgi:hypothetical protein